MLNLENKNQKLISAQYFIHADKANICLLGALLETIFKLLRVSAKAIKYVDWKPFGYSENILQINI